VTKKYTFSKPAELHEHVVAHVAKYIFYLHEFHILCK